ncbi:MAG: hypothetical protein NTW03_12520 [Verrucomicrobia bacterium]|nr:hypothetical protein [Verrucomicrobiota bacterium]
MNETRHQESKVRIPPAGRFRTCFHSVFLSLTLICLASNSSARAVAPAQTVFQQGYDAYAAGAYEQAAALFGELAAREPSVGVYHNLGNAEWKRGRIGDAVLAWERAQWLSPFSANTRANLRFARQKAQLPAPALAWYEICSTWLPVGTWAVLAAGSFWLALAMVLLPGILHWRKADWQQGFAAGSLAIFLLTIPALVGVHTRSELGVVLAKDTPLRLTPTHEGQILGRLPAGEIARIARVRGQYFYVRAGNENAAWVDGSQFGRISAR